MAALLISCYQPPPVVQSEAPPEVKGDIKLDETAPFELGVSGAGGAKPELVTKEDIDEFNPSISPDGKTLLFNAVSFQQYYTTSRYFRGYYQGRRLYGTRRVWRRRMVDVTIAGVNANTGGQRTLYTRTGSRSWTPAWLPTGRSFLYASNQPGSRSLVRSLSSSPNAAITVVVSGQVAPLALKPDVSPDGKRVAFQTLIQGTWQVAISNMDGSRFTMLGRGRAPAWSPDGKTIAYTRIDNRRSHVFIANADSGTNIVQVTSGPDDDFSPDWSPDGKRLVFATNRGWSGAGGTAEKTRNLYIVKTDGSGLTQLTTGRGKTYQPCWGQDGWLYFSSNARGNHDIWRMRPPDAE
ncbi:MAG: hypothetical protein ABI333_15255, partial [bacterium]